MAELLIYLIFVSATSVFIAELLHNIENMKYIATCLQYLGTLSLFILLPCTYILLRGRESKSSIKIGGPRRLVYAILSWLFYIGCIVLLFFITFGCWSCFFSHSQQSWATVLGAMMLFTTVFMVSSFYVVDSKEITVKSTVNGPLTSIAKKITKLRIFLSMKILFAIAAAVLAVLAEISLVKHNNTKLALLEGLLSIISIIIVIFNTHGMGGRLIHLQQSDNANGWKFWQPWVGGAKFVTLQIISWIFFGVSILLQIGFILSILFIGLEIFVGITALAGICCMISEVLMILSLYAFQTPIEAKREINHEIFMQEENKEKSPPPFPPSDEIKTEIEEMSEIKCNGIPILPAASSSSPSPTPPAPALAHTIGERGDEKGNVFHTPIKPSALTYSQQLLQKLARIIKFLHEFIPAILVVNMQYIPFLLLFPMFLISNLELHSVFLHWLLASSAIVMNGMFLAIYKAKEIKQRRKISPPPQPRSAMTTSSATDPTDDAKSHLDLHHDLDIVRTKSLTHTSTSATTTAAAIKSMNYHLLTSLPVSALCVVTPLTMLLYLFPSHYNTTSITIWMVFSLNHLLYIGITYDGAPEFTGCRELESHAGGISTSRHNSKEHTTNTIASTTTATNGSSNSNSNNGINLGSNVNNNDETSQINNVPDSNSVHSSTENIPTGSSSSGTELTNNSDAVPVTPADSDSATSPPEAPVAPSSSVWGRAFSLLTLINNFGEMVRKYFNGTIISETDLSPNQLYIFGFHPHGVIPITILWLRTSLAWDTHFPNVRFCPLTATVLHLVPFMRDLLQWMGGREVSRESFRYTLQQGRNVMIVPGGQLEMMESRSQDRDIRIITKHIGYIRVAIQEGAHLVPIFSFGEVDIIDNIQLPILQRWFLYRFGAAFPVYFYGYFGLPVPRKVNVTVVVGTPIATVKNENPTDEEVQQLLGEYMESLRQLFEKYRKLAGERSDRRLLFIGDFGRPLRFADQ